MSPDPHDVAQRLLRAARDLGFDPVGIAPPTLPPDDAHHLRDWLDARHHADMDYMARAPRADASAWLPGAQSVLVVGLAYPPDLDPTPDPDRARIAAYAQGPRDYHRIFAERLSHLEQLLPDLWPGAHARRFCDTAPLLERAFARAAGLGFIGKNTCLIHPRRGSFFFLGGLVLDCPLPTTPPEAHGGCGTCTRCLDVCPTDAFPAPRVLDANRCIAYLTIEHRGDYPEPLRTQVGNHVFGCDLCQSVCPWNRKFAPPADPELQPEPDRHHPLLTDLYRRARDGFKSLSKHTAWSRTGKKGFLRNLATAMAHGRDPDHLPALDELAQRTEPGVAAHARWARDVRRNLTPGTPPPADPAPTATPPDPPPNTSPG